MNKGLTVEIDKKVFNDAYTGLLLSNQTGLYRYLSLLGGAGSGKSVFMTQRTIIRVLRESGHRILVVRKVASTLRNSVFKLFKDILIDWKLDRYFTISESYMIIKSPNGSEIIFMGIDNAEKMKSIAGITSIWIEEATELTETDFNQLDLRLRGKSKLHKEIALTFNPISDTHWIKKRFYDTIRSDTIRLTTTYKDNRFLDEKYIEVLESLKDSDPVYYAVYCLAEWGSTGNLVWNNYKVKEIPLDDECYDRVFCGLDFGYNDPSAFLKIGEKDGELYILEELYKTHLTNTELIELLSPYQQYRIIADSAEPARIQEFYKQGFNISGCKKKEKNYVRNGIDFIRRKKIWVHPKNKHFISEISGYVYLTDKNGNPTEEPIGVNDHLMSALRYGTEPMRKQDTITFLK